MDRTDVIIVLVTVLAMVVAAKQLKNVPFWLIIVLAAATYPVGRKLLSTLEAATGASSTWASYAFTVSTGLAFTALGSPAVRGFKSFRSARADRGHHCQEIDA
ncbi:hypothetical protein ACIREO_19345 [Streptomyces sp. NPDC102441]|uniref:hypothetical protein n=1 Tax=Streptomyces sp. NPDC102441 TaxID=3366176 RepID=UPI0038048F4F